MSRLSHLADNIAKTLQIKQHDIEPVYLPNMKEIRSLSSLSLSVLMAKRNELETFPEILLVGQKGKKKLRESLNAVAEKHFLPLLSFVNTDIKEHGHWSFYHYLALCTITSNHYNAALKENKHASINLADETAWAEPTLDVPVLALNFVAGQLYRKPLTNFGHYFEQNQVSMDDRVAYIKQQIKLLHA